MRLLLARGAVANSYLSVTALEGRAENRSEYAEPNLKEDRAEGVLLRGGGPGKGKWSNAFHNAVSSSVKTW
jgi:hypothetical protein